MYNSDFSDPITEGKLSVKANGNFFDGLDIELDLSNKSEKKEGNLEVVFESKKFNLKAMSESNKNIEIDLTSDIPNLEKILFKVDSSGGGFESVFRWGQDAKQQIELGYRNEGGEIQISARALQENHIDVALNTGSGKFDLDTKIAGKEMKANVILEGTNVKMEVTEPFFDNGKITFEGKRSHMIPNFFTMYFLPR